MLVRLHAVKSKTDSIGKICLNWKKGLLYNIHHCMDKATFNWSARGVARSETRMLLKGFSSGLCKYHSEPNSDNKSPWDFYEMKAKKTRNLRCWSPEIIKWKRNKGLRERLKYSSYQIIHSKNVIRIFQPGLEIFQYWPNFSKELSQLTYWQT